MLQELNADRTPAPPAMPADKLRAPHEVLRHPAMSVDAKRALLASWASDRYAVMNCPALRRLENGALVSVADILCALNALDQDNTAPAEAPPAMLISLDEKRRHWAKRKAAAFRRPAPGDDDDPPPTPAASAFPVSYPVVDARARPAYRDWR